MRDGGCCADGGGGVDVSTCIGVGDLQELSSDLELTENELLKGRRILELKGCTSSAETNTDEKMRNGH